MVDEMIKEGSRWASDTKEFEVIFVGLNAPGEDSTIFYQNIATKESYSCWQGAFLSRFTEIKNHG
jgi:hypothetical protein